jgi:hypothetical protein
VTGNGSLGPGVALFSPDGVGLAGSWIDLEKLTISFPWGGSVSYAPRDVGFFATMSAYRSAGGHHFVGTTFNGRLWHQLRGLGAPFAFFGDVELEGVGQNVGLFTAVDCG